MSSSLIQSFFLNNGNYQYEHDFNGKHTVSHAFEAEQGLFVRHGVSSKMSFRSARSPFPDPVGLWLTNLLVIRFTRTREESPGKTATVPPVNVRTAAKGPPTWRERLTEIISSFLHCWDRSRMPLTKSLLALTYAFPASSIPLHSFTSCRGQGTNISTVHQQQRHSHSTGYINCNQGADTMRTWGCFSAKVMKKCELQV